MIEFSQPMIEFVQYLDESNLAYLIMLFCFLLMARSRAKALGEVARLRTVLKQVMR